MVRNNTEENGCYYSIITSLLLVSYFITFSIFFLYFSYFSYFFDIFHIFYSFHIFHILQNFILARISWLRGKHNVHYQPIFGENTKNWIIPWPRIKNVDSRHWHVPPITRANSIRRAPLQPTNIFGKSRL